MTKLCHPQPSPAHLHTHPLIHTRAHTCTLSRMCACQGSEEAKKQMDIEKLEAEAAQRMQAETDRAAARAAAGGHDHEAGAGGVEGPDDSKQLRNQFNFSERAAQVWVCVCARAKLQVPDRSYPYALGGLCT